MAGRLKEQSLVPQIIVSSPALRTKTTAEIFTDYLKLPESKLDKTIYEASQKALLNVINKLPNEYDFIGLVGHNPGVAEILYYLTGETREVHTTTVALIHFETDDWGTISRDSGNLTYYSSPME